MRAKPIVEDAIDAPENPLTQNTATAAVKPKPAVPVVGDTLDNPNATPLPAIQPSTSASAVNIDPNAYAPPPQAAQPAVTAPATPLPTLSGDWTPPTAAAGSAPLIASAAGGTMTPQGTKDNSFLGYQTDVGKPGTAEGTFGGYGTHIVPDVGVTMKDYDTKVGEAIKNFDFDFSQINPAELQKLSQMTVNANGAETDQGDALRKKLFQGGTLTPTEQYFLAFQSGQAPQVYRPEYGASGASPTGWKLSQNDMNSLGGAKTLGAVRARQAPQAPAPVNAGNWTAAKPEEQAAGLAAQGLPSPAPAPAAALPATPPPAAAMAGVGPARPVPGSGIAPEPPTLGAFGEMGPRSSGGTPPPPVPAPSLPTPVPSGIQPTASGMGNITQTPVTPENALTNAMLSRAPGADRFKIAQDQWKASEEESAPRYEADLRQAMRKAAAGGALGSGMLQTSIGDIAQNRDIFNRANRTNLLSEALKGTIADQFGDVGIAQQQQGFQQGQQQQAFGNEVTRAGLQEALTSGSFQRALQQLTAGSGGNPADTALLLSQIFGGQASEAGSSLAQLLAGLGQKSTAGGATAGGGSAPSTSNLLSTLLQYAPTLFEGGKPAAGLPTGQAIGGGTGPTSPFAFTG